MNNTDQQPVLVSPHRPETPGQALTAMMNLYHSEPDLKAADYSALKLFSDCADGGVVHSETIKELNEIQDCGFVGIAARLLVLIMANPDHIDDLVFITALDATHAATKGETMTAEIASDLELARRMMKYPEFKATVDGMNLKN